jgi:hypothetical protein
VLSLSVHHPTSTLYIIADSKTKDYIENGMTPRPRVKIQWKIDLDDVSQKSRAQMEKEGTWTKFQM